MATPGRACEARARSSDAAPDMPPRGRPVGTPAGRTGSAVQTVLDGLRGAEGQLLRSRNLDGFAGRGVTTFARGRFLDLELAEAVHRDFVALGGGVGDRGENGIDSLLRIDRKSTRLNSSH